MYIDHGVPDASGFVLVAQPGKGIPIGDRVQNPVVMLTLRSPKDGSERKAEIHDLWRFNINDDKEANLINAWAKLAYGITGPQLLNVMRKRYPDMTTQVEFLLLKLI